MATRHEGRYEEVEYAGQWSGSADHNVKTTTRVTTRKWPPDNFFQEAEARRAERLREEAERDREKAKREAERQRKEDELDVLRIALRKKKEALQEFDQNMAAAHLAPRYDPPEVESPTSMTPPKLTTKVVVRKWPPDSWFEDERKKAAQSRQQPDANQLDNGQRSRPVPPGQSYPVGGYSPLPVQQPHQPVPLDPTARMYNPFGFWPYAEGQPKVRPPPPSMMRLREELPMLEATRMAQNPYAAQAPYPAPAEPYAMPEDPYTVHARGAVPAHRDSYHQEQMHAHRLQGSMHAHHTDHQPIPVMAGRGHPAEMPEHIHTFMQEQEESYELGDHFQCLGCGCHIRPSEVVYRPRTVPCLPPEVEHCPVPLEKPGRPPVVLKPRAKPAPQLPRMPSLQMEPPREELKIKDVEPFDFDKARREGMERAQKEKPDEYGIKTVENFDFEAARRAGPAQTQAAHAQQTAEPERVKAVEDFDFDTARRQGPQQTQQAQQAMQRDGPRNPALEAARARVQAAAQARFDG